MTLAKRFPGDEVHSFNAENARLLAFFLAGLVACSFTLFHRADSTLLIGLSTAGICIAIWHGAYDGVTARALLEPRLKRHWGFAFIGGYCGLLLAGALLWLAAPAIALALFLLYSSWHFGTEEDSFLITPATALVSLAVGALPLAAACYWHPAAVLPIFRAMLRSDQSGNDLAAVILSVTGKALLPCLLLAVGSALLQDRSGWHRSRFTLALLSIELVVFYLCSPLIAFAVFFCVWHTPQHLLAGSREASGSFSGSKLRSNLYYGFLPWLISILGLAVLIYMIPSRARTVSASLFIVLSVLTVPHMALHELRRRQLNRHPAKVATLHGLSA